MGGSSTDLLLLHHPNNKSSHPHLSKGSIVEVSTDEEGFKGVRFIATVLVPPASFPSPRSLPKRKTPNRYSHCNDKHLVYVQYHNLLNEDGSNLLTEHVHYSCIRPLPPPGSDPHPNFDLGDVVDAYYRDGWWTGVVTALIDGQSRFVVTFQNPPDVIEFGISELRVHREWLDGKWVQPEKQRTAGLMFSAGKKVEVSFEKEDSRDAWFPATVIRDVGNGSFLVEYQCRGVDDDEAVSHQVTVDYLHLRPSPPHLRDKNFDLLEKVDAFYDFGWWSGVITKELADSRYIVFFKHTNKEKELGHSELRPHMDWKDGKWFSSSQDVIIPSNNQGHMGHVGNISNGSDTAVSHGESGAMQGESRLEIPSALNSMENKIEQTTPCIETESHVVTSPKNIKQTNLVNDDTNSQPSKKLKEANVAYTLCQLNTSSSIVPCQDTVVGYTGPTTGYTDIHSSEEPMASDQLSAITESFSHGRKVRSKRGKIGEPNNQLIAPAKKPGRPPRSPQGVVQGESAEDIVNIPVVIGLESNGVKNARAKRAHLSSPKSSVKQKIGQKEPLVDSQTPTSVKDKDSAKLRSYPCRHDTKPTRVWDLCRIRDTRGWTRLKCIRVTYPTAEMKEVNNSEGGTVSTQKRKRGRPPKALSQSPKILMADNKQNGDAAPNLMAVEDSLKKDVGSPTSFGTESVEKDVPIPAKEPFKLVGDNTPKQKNTLSSVMKISFPKKDKLLEDKSALASAEQPKKPSSVRGKRGRRRTISVNTESSNQDSQDVSIEKVVESSEKGPSRKDDMAADVLPSTMSDDQPLSMWFEGMHSPSIVDFSDPGASLVVRNKEQDIEPSETPSVVSQAPSGGNIQSLPFVKNTPLWETIASMEVFRMIPQKPHFRPLDGFKESSREGLAIGHMVNFASVVEKTCALKFDDPRSTIEDYLETLLELESHGFNVKVVRDRLMALVSFKSKHDELHNMSNEVRSRIEEQSVETSKFDEELDEINKQIRELEAKRSLVMSVKEMKKSEMTSLEKEVLLMQEGTSAIQIEFDKLACAPWQA